MNLQNKDDFFNFSPNERKAFLAYWNIRLKDIQDRLKRTATVSAISMAINNKPRCHKLEKRISSIVHTIYSRKSNKQLSN